MVLITIKVAVKNELVTAYTVWTSGAEHVLVVLVALLEVLKWNTILASSRAFKNTLMAYIRVGLHVYYGV